LTHMNMIQNDTEQFSLLPFPYQVLSDKSVL